MEIQEFRLKIQQYLSISQNYFLPAFIDASHEHSDNLELILEDMEKAKIKYQSSMGKR